MNLVRKYPLSIYYAMTFAVSWVGILWVVGGPGGIPATAQQMTRLLPLTVPALLAGPAICGPLLTALTAGWAGLRDLFKRLCSWRVSLRWYALGLLTAPLLMLLLPLVLAMLFPEFLPRIFIKNDTAALLLLGIMAGLGAGIFEELGWSGFAVPRLLQRYSVLKSGLIAGFLWGAWHLPVNFWSSGTEAGALSITLLLHSLFFSFGILPAYRVLMVWVYERTRGSLFLVMLMHMSLTAGNVLFVPQESGIILVAWSLVLAAALWIIVALLAGRKIIVQQG